MTGDLSQERVVEAGIDVFQLEQTRVLVKIGDVEPDHIIRHPAYALCRGLTRLGFTVEVSGSPYYYDALQELGEGAIKQSVGLWLTEESASLAPNADLLVDLCNDGESHQHSAKLSSSRGCKCLYLKWGSSFAAVSNSPIQDEELTELMKYDKALDGINGTMPIRQIISGLALQEVVMYAGNVDLAAPLEYMVIYNAATNDRSARAVEEPWEPRMIEGAILDVVGLGGTGTFFLESILPMLGGNCSLFIYDFDKVGHENLYHGVYTMNDVGRDKVIVTAARIHHARPDMRIIPLIIPYQERPNGAPKPTARILCVDNWQTRLFANRLSITDGVPLLECGSSPLAAQARSYVPGRSCCLECRIPKLSEKAAREEQPASCAVNPVRTLPGVNMIISGILALETVKTLNPVHFGLPSQGTITYDARVQQRFGLSDTLPACKHRGQR
jgi:molybdopterin/thiamine biosynthesis adenylyltransferase